MVRILVVAALAAMLAGCTTHKFEYLCKDAEGLMTQIPHVSGARISNNYPDEQGLRCRAMIGDGPILRNAEEFDAVGQLAWNDSDMLLHVDVTDVTPNESADPATPYMGDSVEFFLMRDDGTGGMVQLVATPGRTGRQPQVQLFDYRAKYQKTLGGSFKPQLTCKTRPGGYSMDLAIPFRSLSLEPVSRGFIRVQFGVNDSNGRDRARLVWTNGDSAISWMKLPRAQLMGHNKGSASIATWGGYDGFSSVYVNVVGEEQYAGGAICVKEGNELIAAETMRREGARSAARIRFRAPSIGKTMGDLQVTCDKTAIGAIQMPDLRKLREAEFKRGAWSPGRWGKVPDYLTPQCRPEVFAGERFPAAAYSQPSKIRELVGSWTISTKYYDEAFNPVTTASKPGRYGAVITVTPAVGEPIVAYQTLVRSDVQTGQTSALKLAAETAKVNDAAKYDRDWWHALRKTLGSAVKYEYYVRLPGGYDKDPARKWPVIIYLHGSGGGEKMQTVQNDGPQQKAQKSTDFAFITVSLRSPGGWYPPAVKDVVDEVESKYRTDANRYYLTGFSMGGMGTWMVALDQPERFAAIAPVAGRDGDPSQASRIRNVATWVVNGADDTTTTSADALKAVNALKAAGAEVKWTEIPSASHVDALNTAYAWDELYSWFLAHTRKQ